MIGAVRQTGSSARPSITTGSDVRTAVADAGGIPAAEDPAGLWRRHAIARTGVIGSMGFHSIRPNPRTGCRRERLENNATGQGPVAGVTAAGPPHLPLWRRDPRAGRSGYVSKP